jgi:hypothetical protein
MSAFPMADMITTRLEGGSSGCGAHPMSRHISIMWAAWRPYAFKQGW